MGLYRFFLPVPEFLQDFSRYPNQLPVWFRFLQTRIAWINRGLRPLFTPGIKTNIHHFPVHPAYVPGTLSKSLLLDSLMLYLWSLFLLPTTACAEFPRKGNFLLTILVVQKAALYAGFWVSTHFVSSANCVQRTLACQFFIPPVLVGNSRSRNTTPVPLSDVDRNASYTKICCAAAVERACFVAFRIKLLH
jgi:hypothetical protein